jgi:hypothetical protein
MTMEPAAQPPGLVEQPVGAVYLSLSSPPKIVQATPEWLAIFALEAQACVGRTMNLLVGPDTDMSKFKELLDVVRNHKSGKTRMVMYTAQGDRGLYLISGKPSRSTHGQQVLCKLKMQRINVIPYKTAAAQDGTVKLVVEAVKPFRIVCASDEFADQYGISREQAMSRTLGIIQGPETDMHTWLSLLDHAISGFSRQTTIVTYARDGTAVRGNMRLKPVLGKVDIDFILVAFGERPDANEAQRTRRPDQAVQSSSEERDHSAHAREQCSNAKSHTDAGVCPQGPAPPGSPQTQRRVSDRSVSSVSMGSVNRMIELKMRAKQKAKADRMAAERAAAAAQGQQAIAVKTSGGVLAFLSSLLMTILVLLHLATPPEAIEFKNQTSQDRSARRHCFSNWLGTGMGEGELDLFSPY